MTSEQTADAAAAVPEAPYDRFAADYRDWWAPVIAPASVRLLDRLDGQVPADGPTELVDIGTGTGTLALAALRRWPRAQVIGVDPAIRLLQMAEAAARGAGVGDRLTTRVGEAGRLPLPDGSVDGALTSFVLQLTPNRAAAVREAFRVLRPGGVVACLTWRADEDPFEPDGVYDDALDALRIEPPDRPDHDDRSYTTPESAAAEFRGAGFRSVRARTEWLDHQFTPQSYLDLLEHWIDDDTFGSIDEPMRRRLRDEVLRRLARLSPRDLAWRRPLISVVGLRPEATG